MTETMIRIMFVLGIAGHAINMYCDRILSIFPNGTIKFANIKEVRKDGVLANMMEGVSADVPMRSAVLGAFALVLEFFSYFALAIYTYERSPILGAIMFVAVTIASVVGAAFHVKCALAEYVFLKLGRDSRGKELAMDLLDTAPVLKICGAGLFLYLVVLMIAIVTGVIGFPVWAVLFTMLPIAVLLFPLKIIGTLHIAAMISMFAWIFFI
jgi:hypothetical protein